MGRYRKRTLEISQPLTSNQDVRVGMRDKKIPREFSTLGLLPRRETAQTVGLRTPPSSITAAESRLKPAVKIFPRTPKDLTDKILNLRSPSWSSLDSLWGLSAPSRLRKPPYPQLQLDPCKSDRSETKPAPDPARPRSPQPLPVVYRACPCTTSSTFRGVYEIFPACQILPAGCRKSPNVLHFEQLEGAATLAVRRLM